MRYKEHKTSDKGYIVIRCSGFGTPEANYEDEEIVFETDDKDEAYKEADRLFHTNNTPEEIKSTWCSNTYWVHANTNSEIGKKELAEFEKEVDGKIRVAIENGTYKEINFGEYTVGVLNPIENDPFSIPSNIITGSPSGEVIWNGEAWEKIIKNENNE